MAKEQALSGVNLTDLAKDPLDIALATRLAGSEEEAIRILKNGLSFCEDAELRRTLRNRETDLTPFRNADLLPLYEQRAFDKDGLARTCPTTNHECS